MLLEHSGCVCHVLCASCAIVCHCQTNQQLRVWLRTKPECLVIVQSVIIFLSTPYFPFSPSASGLFFLFVHFLI